MAADTVTAKITGLEELKATLSGLSAKLRANAVLVALRAGAKPVRLAIQARTPLLKTTTYAGRSAIKRGVRKVGTVRDAIKVRTSKRDKANGDVGVFVNVVPAKGAKFKSVTYKFLGVKSRVKGRKMVRASQRGAKSPNDPYYWRWVNFGNKKQGKPGAHMLESGAERAFGQAVDAIGASLGPAIDKLNTRGAR